MRQAIRADTKAGEAEDKALGTEPLKLTGVDHLPRDDPTEVHTCNLPRPTRGAFFGSLQPAAISERREDQSNTVRRHKETVNAVFPILPYSHSF